MSASEAKSKVAAMIMVLEGQYDSRVWSAEVLRDAAPRFKFFPSYAELKPVLDMWASVYRVRDNPEITQRVMGQIGQMERNYLTEPAVSQQAISLGKHLRVVGDN